MSEPQASQGSGSSESVVAIYSDELLIPLPAAFEGLASELIRTGGLGLILIDASSLGEIERLYGERPFRRAIEALAHRVRTRVTREAGEDCCITSGALAEEHILVFLPRPASDAAFYTKTLPSLAEELRSYVEISLKRIVYPYLAQAPEMPVGSGLALHRPFQRPETQIRRLVESTLRRAQFELARRRHERGRALEQVLFDQTVTSVYEPIVQLSDRTLIGYEALSRGPIGSGLETPLSLFAVAERNDFEYELDALCRQKALRNATGLEKGLKLFVNILPTSFQHPDFEPSRLKELLAGPGLAPRDLVLEVSERQSISNFHIFREAIDRLSKLGFTIALDDVGTGYSSLEATMELSPEFLKIDMSLVRGIDQDPHKQELLRGLQKLARRMNARIIAEGIETQAELDTVTELGVDCGQGYLLGRGGPVRSRTDAVSEE